MSHKKTRHRRRRLPRIRKRTPPGSAPGLFLVPESAHPPTIRVIRYTENEIHEEEIDNVHVLPDLLTDDSITWINVDGLADAEVLRQLAEIFDFHRLALEDVMNVHQRSKIEEYADHLFIVLRMVLISDSRLDNEQLSIFMGKNYVLTLQERPGDCFDGVRTRLRHGKGLIRKRGADYLAYALIDAVVDGYFPVVDSYGEQMERLDVEVTNGDTMGFMASLHGIRGDLAIMRRAIRPLRDALVFISRDMHQLVSPDTRLYLRDCYDHVIQLIDLLETYREMCSDLRDYYLSIVNNRMNEVMKVLTVIGTIFIPLGFIAGIYGMNFNTESTSNMPELNWPYGYVFALSMMSLVAMGLLGFLWKKGWLGSPTKKTDLNAGEQKPPEKV